MPLADKRGAQGPDDLCGRTAPPAIRLLGLFVVEMTRMMVARQTGELMTGCRLAPTIGPRVLNPTGATPHWRRRGLGIFPRSGRGGFPPHWSDRPGKGPVPEG